MNSSIAAAGAGSERGRAHAFLYSIAGPGTPSLSRQPLEGHTHTCEGTHTLICVQGVSSLGSRQLESPKGRCHSSRPRFRVRHPSGLGHLDAQSPARFHPHNPGATLTSLGGKHWGNNLYFCIFSYILFSFTPAWCTGVGVPSSLQSPMGLSASSRGDSL